MVWCRVILRFHTVKHIRMIAQIRWYVIIIPHSSIIVCGQDAPYSLPSFAPPMDNFSRPTATHNCNIQANCQMLRFNRLSTCVEVHWFRLHRIGNRLHRIFYKKLKNVSCEYDRVNGWNSTLQAAWYIKYLHKLSFARVQQVCFILMKDIGRWLPWMLPGSTGRFSITILCTDTI